MKKIGIFDSGMGGLQTLKIFKEIHPQYDYVFLGDTQHSPYGEKTGEQIKEYTFAALHYMFDYMDVALVILACNTASAFAIRDWQEKYPSKKVLSVTIPGVEAMIKYDVDRIGVLVTQATMRSGVYPYLFSRLGGNQKTAIDVVAAPKIVGAIESGMSDLATRKEIISEYREKFSHSIDVLVLGCTHYPIWINEIQSLFVQPVIDPGYESAMAMNSYFTKHTAIASVLGKTGTIMFYVTGDLVSFAQSAKYVWGEEVVVNHVIVQ